MTLGQISFDGGRNGVGDAPLVTNAANGVSRRLELLTAFSTGPRLPALFDQKPDNRQRGDAVNPPRADSPLGGETDDDHKREPAAGHGLHRICSQRTTAELLRDRNFPVNEVAHGRNGGQGHDEAGPRERLAGSRPQAQRRRDRHISSQGQKQRPRNPARGPLGFLRKALAAPKLDRQSPDQNAGGRDFDEAIQAKGRQNQAAGDQPGSDGDSGLDGHPADRQPFEPEGLTDQGLSLAGLSGPRRHNQRRRTAFVCATARLDRLDLTH
jgi:hypothetical protein